jgi:hypothetical protein
MTKRRLKQNNAPQNAARNSSRYCRVGYLRGIRLMVVLNKIYTHAPGTRAQPRWKWHPRRKHDARVDLWRAPRTELNCFVSVARQATGGVLNKALARIKMTCLILARTCAADMDADKDAGYTPAATPEQVDRLERRSVVNADLEPTLQSTGRRPSAHLLSMPAPSRAVLNG